MSSSDASSLRSSGIPLRSGGACRPGRVRRAGPRPALPLGRARSQPYPTVGSGAHLLRFRTPGAHRAAAARPVRDAGGGRVSNLGQPDAARRRLGRLHRHRDLGTAARMEHAFRSPVATVEDGIGGLHRGARAGRGAAEPDAAIVVAGDINADVESAVFRRLTVGGVLRHAWEVASDRLTPQWGTFSNYRRRRPGGKRIDLILVGPGVDVVSAAINAVRFDGRSASDHEPVQAVLRYAALGSRRDRLSSAMMRAFLGSRGVAEVIADALRVLAAVSIVVAGVGWGPLSGISLAIVLGAMLVPRALSLRPAFDIAFGIVSLVAVWSSVLGIYVTTRSWDLPIHFLANGLYAALCYIVLVRLGVLADATNFPHPTLSAAVMTTALGLSLGVPGRSSSGSGTPSSTARSTSATRLDRRPALRRSRRPDRRLQHAVPHGPPRGGGPAAPPTLSEMRGRSRVDRRAARTPDPRNHETPSRRRGNRGRCLDTSGRMCRHITVVTPAGFEPALPP